VAGVLAFYFFTLLLGVVLALHLAMNSEEGKSIGNSRVANAFFGAFVRWRLR